MKTNIQFALFFSVIAVFGLSSCSLLQLAMKSPEVKLDKVRVTDPTLSNAVLMVDLNVLNPNDSDMKIDGIKYQLSLNGKEFAEGAYDQVTELPATQTVKVSLPIKVEYSRVFDSLISAFQKPESKYQIQGAARLGAFTIPFKEEGTVKWQGEK